MNGGIMNCESVPQFFSTSLPQKFCAGFQTVSIEIIHNEMNCFSIGIVIGDFHQHFCKIGSCSSLCHLCDVLPSFRLYGTEYICTSASNILTIPLFDFTWFVF